jgi:hypothetical protein
MRRALEPADRQFRRARVHELLTVDSPGEVRELLAEQAMRRSGHADTVMLVARCPA